MNSSSTAMFDPKQNPVVAPLLDPDINPVLPRLLGLMDLGTGFMSRGAGTLLTQGRLPTADELIGKNYQSTPTAGLTVAGQVAENPVVRSIAGMVPFVDQNTAAAVPSAILGGAAEVLLDPETIMTIALARSTARMARAPEKFRAAADASATADASAWRAAQQAERDRIQAAQAAQEQQVRQVNATESRVAELRRQAQDAARARAAAEEAHRNAPLQTVAETAEERLQAAPERILAGPASRHEGQLTVAPGDGPRRVREPISADQPPAPPPPHQTPRVDPTPEPLGESLPPPAPPPHLAPGLQDRSVFDSFKQHLARIMDETRMRRQQADRAAGPETPPAMPEPEPAPRAAEPEPSIGSGEPEPTREQLMEEVARLRRAVNGMEGDRRLDGRSSRPMSDPANEEIGPDQLVEVEPEDTLFPPAQEKAPVAPPEATGQQSVAGPARAPVSPDPAQVPDVHPDLGDTKVPSEPPLRQGSVVEVDPDDVLVDAKTYQFKSGGDAQGVTDRLLDVKRWDPVKSGKVIIHQRKDGKLYIVDGHQRLAFAKRAKAAGQEVYLDAMIYREADGFSPATMRIMAAGKNLAENSGTSIDAARVIREAGEDHPALQDIPKSSTVFQDGRALAKLGPEAFEAVVNEAVPANYAAHVGRLLDDPAEQIAAIRVLERTRPQNSNQALSIVQDVKELGFVKKDRTRIKGTEKWTQPVLFGDDFWGTELEDLYGERAIILDSAARAIRNDKYLFRAIVKGEGRLTETGNILAETENRGRLTEDELLLRKLDSTKYKGPASKALNDAARRLKAGESKARCVEDFLRVVREQVLGDFQLRKVPGGSSLEPGGGAKAGLVAEPTPVPEPGGVAEAGPVAAPTPVPEPGPATAGGFTVGQRVLVTVRKREIPGVVRRVNADKNTVIVHREDGKTTAYKFDRVRSAEEAPPSGAAPASPEASVPEATTLEASRPSAPMPRRVQAAPAAPAAPGPAAPAAPAAPGPAHRPTHGTGVAIPLPAPLPKGQIPDVQSKQSLARGIAEALGVRFQYGRAVGMRKDNPGRYHPKRNLVELAHSGDLDALYHEAGHALDVNHGIRGALSSQAMSEVERLADPNQTPGTMSSWSQGMSKDRQQMEGLAELVRMWFEDDTRARQVAPHAIAELNVLLDGAGDLGRKLRKAQTDVKLWRESPSASRIKSQIVFDRPGTPTTASDLITSVYDQFHALHVLSESLRSSKGVRNLAPSEDPYILARLTKGLPKIVEAFLGTRSKKTGEIYGGSVDFSTRELKPGSKSLKAILEPLEDDADKSSKFVTYLVAKRAQEYHDRGLHPGFHRGDVRQTLQDLETPEFKQIAQDIYKWQDDVLQYAVDGGFLDASTAKAFRAMNQSYVPYHRLIEIGANELPELGGGTGKGLLAVDPRSFKRVRGLKSVVASTEIANPLESMIMNTMAIIQATERNRVGQVLAKHWDDNRKGVGGFYRETTRPTSITKATGDELVSAQKLRRELENLGADLSMLDDADLKAMLANFEGSIMRKKGVPDAGTNTIRVKMPDGRIRMFELNPDIYKAFTALEHEQVPAFVNWLGNFAQGLRLGSTTLSAPFVMRNLVRDSFAAGLVSRVGSVPLANIIQGIAAMFNPRLVQEWALNGGAHSLEANLYSGDGFKRAMLEVASGLSPEARKNTFLPRRMVKELHERPLSWARKLRRNSKSRAGKTIGSIAEGFIENPIDMLGRLAEASEMTVRMAEYKNALDYYRKKYPNWSDADVRMRAAYESRDLLDFSMSGAGTVRHVRRIVPFYGARMTGNYRLFRALKENPKGTAAKGLWMVSVPTLAFYAWNQAQNAENYNQLPQRERDVFWHIAIGTGPEDFIRIPKPFLEGAIFGSTIERFAQFAWQKDPEAYRGFLKSLGGEVLPVNVMDPASIPADLGGPLTKALIEVGTNYDYFRQRPIVPPYMRDDRRNPQPAWMESNEYTSATSKALGKIMRQAGIEFSPMMADHVLHTMTGTAGTDFVRYIVDPAVHAMTGEDMPKRSTRKWMGFVYTENVSESEDRFWRFLKDVGERASEAKARGEEFEHAALWNELRAAAKRVQGIRRQLHDAEDEAQRRRLLDELRSVTSKFTPPAGPNVLRGRSNALRVR